MTLGWIAQALHMGTHRVAQICNLLYRRFVIGRASKRQSQPNLQRNQDCAVSRPQACDTAQLGRAATKESITADNADVLCGRNTAFFRVFRGSFSSVVFNSIFALSVLAAAPREFFVRFRG